MGSLFRKHFNQILTRFNLLSQLGKLAKQLLASNGNITGLVDRMISEQLIERRNNPNIHNDHYISPSIQIVDSWFIAK